MGFVVVVVVVVRISKAWRELNVIDGLLSEDKD
jgi:hypothetical protein